MNIHEYLAMKCLTIELHQELKSFKEVFFSSNALEQNILSSKFNLRPILRGGTVWFPCATLSWKEQTAGNQTRSHQDPGSQLTGQDGH